MNAQKKSKPRPKVVERKLGREKASGQYWDERKLIEIDPRLLSHERLYVLVHEMVHHVFPRFPEMKVRGVAKQLSDAVWKDGYRRVQP